MRVCSPLRVGTKAGVVVLSDVPRRARILDALLGGKVLLEREVRASVGVILSLATRVLPHAHEDAAVVIQQVAPGAQGRVTAGGATTPDKTDTSQFKTGISQFKTDISQFRTQQPPTSITNSPYKTYGDDCGC
jgi:hypothetical protein